MGSWEGSPRLHPGGEGGAAAAHGTTWTRARAALPTAAPAAVAMVTGWPARGKGRGSARQVLKTQDWSEGPSGCVGTWVGGHCPGVATCGRRGVRFAVNKNANAEACVQGGCRGVAEPWKMAEGVVWEGAAPALER